jgi:endonuclease-3
MADEMVTETESQERRSARAREIMSRLRQMYPDARCSLDFSTPHELLVATVLSAQCTDERVNQVTATLFKKYRSPADFANADLAELEQDVKPTGFYRNKAKLVRDGARMIVERFHGEVPRTMVEVTAIPGAARKTANVVLGNAYGLVEGVVVDTHVGRVSRRLRLTTQEDPVKVEQDLMRLLPQEDWLDFSHCVIYHGRAICQARRPLCEQCDLLGLCPTGQTTLAVAATASETSVPQSKSASGKSKASTRK